MVRTSSPGQHHPHHPQLQLRGAPGVGFGHGHDTKPLGSSGFFGGTVRWRRWALLVGAVGTGPCSAPLFAGAGNSGYRSIGRGREGAAAAMHHPRCRRLQLTLHNEPTPLPAGGGIHSLCPPPCHHLGPSRGRVLERGAVPAVRQRGGRWQRDPGNWGWVLVIGAG